VYCWCKDVQLKRKNNGVFTRKAPFFHRCLLRKTPTRRIEKIRIMTRFFKKDSTLRVVFICSKESWKEEVGEDVLCIFKSCGQVFTKSSV